MGVLDKFIINIMTPGVIKIFPFFFAPFIHSSPHALLIPLPVYCIKKWALLLDNQLHVIKHLFFSVVFPHLFDISQSRTCLL